MWLYTILTIRHNHNRHCRYSNIYIYIPGEDSVISLLNSYLDLNFDVLHSATSNRYVDGDEIRLVNLGPIGLFSNYELTTSSGKHSEDITHPDIVSLMYKLITSAKDTDDLSIAYDRDRKRREGLYSQNFEKLSITTKTYL